MTEWNKDSKAYELFIEPRLGQKMINGEVVVTQGIPSMSLTWNVNSTRFSAMQLYKKNTVPISEVMLIIRSNARHLKPSQSTNDDARKAVADFLVAQLQLAAEMCLGRNYPIIGEIEKLYSYEMLISIIKSSNSEMLQSAAAYLLLKLYVDRDPQSEVQLPRLTRILSEISKKENSELVCIVGAEYGKFSLVQFLIANHLESIKGKAFPLYSYDMFGLLHELVRFNFYGQVEILQETIESLMQCLKRDDNDLNVEGTGVGMSSSLMKLSVNNSSKSTSRRATMHKSATSKTMSSNADDEALDKEESKIEVTKLPPREPIKFDELAQHVLENIESLPTHLAMAAFAMLASACTVYTYMTGYSSFIFDVIEYGVLYIFAIEIILHITFHRIVRKELLTYFSDVMNILDIATCVLYGTHFLFLSSTYAFVKLTRLIRLVILVRVYYAIKAAQRLRESMMNDNGANWAVSARHQKTNAYTLKTMVRMVNILNTVQKNIDDRMLSLFLKRFKAWSEDPRANVEQAKTLFKAVVDESATLTISNEEHDNTLIDVLFYSDSSLVQSTLNLLMNHHSSRRTFLDNINKLQLITSVDNEGKYFRLEKIVNILKRHADTHEIWGKLENADFRDINVEMHKYLLELTAECKKLRETLKFDEMYEPVKYIQNILRNLGCFDVCIKVAQLVLHINPNDTLSDISINTRTLALEGNRLLHWLILDNPANQALAYGELKFFIKTIDIKVDSHRVISAIFRNNIELMELVPKKYIAEFVDMVCNVGRFPQYLSLMSSIINVGEKNVIANQYEVIKLMTSPENQKKIVHYFTPVSHQDYAKKIRLMSSYLNVKDVSVDELPSDLAYHLELMKLLSSCTVGRSGMTTIEAKVQSMFHFVDIVEAMLDPNCLLLAKIRLGSYLYNAVLDVETPVPAIKDAACVWKILIAAQDVFTFAKDELRQIEKNGWGAATSNRQKIEYMIVNAMIVESYFTAYFDRTIFKPEIGQTAFGVERVSLKEAQGNEIIRSLYTKLSALYEMLSPLITEEHHNILYSALVALNNAAKEKMIAEVENIHESFLKNAEEYEIEGADKLGKAYDNFIVALNQSTEVKENIDEQIQHFINKIEEIPWKKNAGNAPVAFEPLVEKLVHHVRGCVRLIVHGEDSMKYMDAAETKTGIWILRIFRTMIENRWGMTIYERDDDGGEEQDDAVVDLMDVYNESGVTEMCLDLIAKGIDIALQAEALKLLVGMLFKEGGALDIQKSIHAHLAQPGSDMFFRTVRHILHNLMSWHKWNGIIVLEGDAEPELPDEIIIVRCLQLMCEGHYGPNQDIMREQPNNNVSINLLDDFVLYLQCLDPIKCRTTTTAELAVSATILEVIQGPCEGNQDYFALSTELIETLNRKLRQHPVHDCDEEQEMELKKGAIDIFQALLEGQGRKTAVYERMLSVIHVDVILVLCKGEHEESEEEVKESKKAEEEESDISVELRTESLVLLQMLTDFRPTLKKELGLDEDMSGLGGDSVACIEVVWRGELQRRFFHIPDICQSLAKSTKDNFILNVKRASAEDKLYGLLETSKEMYREVLHQEFLKAYKIDTWFSRTTMDRCIWANFYIVLTINVLFVLFYTTRTVPCIPFSEADDGFNQYIDTTYDPDTEISTEIGRTCTEVLISNKIVISSITALNIALICLATFTLVSTLVVRAPVNFQAYVEDKKFGYLKSIVYTAMDFMTLYYGSYLALAYVGLIYQPTLSFLLLDFIQISPTTQAVLRAVYNPRKQIFMTLVLTFIIMYIFAIFQFFFVNNSDNFTDYPTTITLGNMYKFLLRWGLPYNTPQNQMVLTIYSFRVVSDLAFFMSCLIMLNILKGITIDTFVELRKSLEARMDDTTLKCFICGIEKNTFNRTLDRTAFALHIKHDQNLWNYLYFIMYVWQQDKDDDDGLESYVRKCIASNDLIWFPMNKAIRLAEHIAKGDVHSIKYKFRKDMERSENIIYSRMNEFKEQVSRTITRVEKALEYENEESGKRGRAASRQLTAPGKVPPNTPGLKSSLKSGKSTANVFSRQGTEDNLSLVGSISTLDSARSARGDKTPAPRNVNFNMDAITSAPPPQRAMVHSTTALDADNLGQMHMRIVYISGMIINPSHMKFIRVRVITEFQTSAVKPIKEVQIVNSLASPAMAKLNPGVNTKDSEVYATRSMEKVSAGLRNTRSSFSLNSDAFNNLKKSLSFSGKFHKTGGPKDTELDPSLSQTQIRFDILDNPAILVHQGSLPKSDLSKIMVKIQILFGTEEPAFDDYSDMTYLAGVKVPLIQLIAKAHDGGLLEVPFRQREVEVNAPAREISASDFVTFKTPPKTPPKSPMLSPPDSSRGMLRSPPGESISRTVTLPENDQCVIAMSAIASYKLLQDFALIRS